MFPVGIVLDLHFQGQIGIDLSNLDSIVDLHCSGLLGSVHGYGDRWEELLQMRWGDSDTGRGAGSSRSTGAVLTVTKGGRGVVHVESCEMSWNNPITLYIKFLLHTLALYFCNKYTAVKIWEPKKHPKEKKTKILFFIGTITEPAHVGHQMSQHLSDLTLWQKW